MRDCRDIDPFDPGYFHFWKEQRERQEAALRPDCAVVLPKMIRAAFHKYGKHAPRVVRLHTIARLHFYRKGHFTLSEMADVYASYGWSNSREQRRRLKAELKAAPQWFTETKDGVFRFKSWRKIAGIKRTQKADFIQIKKSDLEKNQGAAFTRLLIRIQASGQVTATENLCNQTGYKRAAVFQALKDHKRVNVRITVSDGYTSKYNAIKARRRFYADGLLCSVVESEGKYSLQVTVGNSFAPIKDASSDGKAALRGTKAIKDAPSDPVKVKSKASTVFLVYEQTPATVKNALTGRAERIVNASFLTPEAETAFFARHYSLTRCRRTA